MMERDVMHFIVKFLKEFFEKMLVAGVFVKYTTDQKGIVPFIDDHNYLNRKPSLAEDMTIDID